MRSVCGTPGLFDSPKQSFACSQYQISRLQHPPTRSAPTQSINEYNETSINWLCVATSCVLAARARTGPACGEEGLRGLADKVKDALRLMYDVVHMYLRILHSPAPFGSSRKSPLDHDSGEIE